LFFLLGIMAATGLNILLKYNRQFRFSILVWIILSFGSLLLLFGIAWAFSSILEGVPRAAIMGLFFFCLPAFILIVLGRRLALRGNR